MFVVGSYKNARKFRVSFEIARRCEIRIHAHDFSKRLRQRKSEESHSGIQIQCQFAAGMCHDGLQQILDQEAVYLKKRKMADAVFVSTYFLCQISRATQFELVFLLVQQQQALSMWKRAAERGNEFFGRF